MHPCIYIIICKYVSYNIYIIYIYIHACRIYMPMRARPSFLAVQLDPRSSVQRAFQNPLDLVAKKCCKSMWAKKSLRHIWKDCKSIHLYNNECYIYIVFHINHRIYIELYIYMIYIYRNVYTVYYISKILQALVYDDFVTPKTITKDSRTESPVSENTFDHPFQRQVESWSGS